jgi:chromosome segregation ATPase
LVSRYLYLDGLFRDREVLEIGASDSAGATYLARHGAKRVASAPIELLAPSAGGKTPSAVDVVSLVDGGGLLVDGGRLTASLERLRSLLRPDGVLVLAVAADALRRPSSTGADAGVGYRELVAAVRRIFTRVRVVGQSPFVAFTLVGIDPSSSREPDVGIDASLLEGRAEPLSHYVLVAGAGVASWSAAGASSLEIVQLPAARAFSPLAAHPAAPSPASALSPDGSLVARIHELEAALSLREQGLDERLAAAQQHEAQSRHLGEVLAERTDYIQELEDELRSLQDRLERSTKERQAAERQLASTSEEDRRRRSRLAEVEGLLLRRQVELEAASGTAPVSSAEADRQAAALAEAQAALGVSAREVEGLKEELARRSEQLSKAEAAALRAEELETKNDELWRKLSKAESETDRARDELMRRITNERPAANLQVTRALEDATKKLVSCKDELVQVEREAREARARVAALESEAESIRASGDVLRVELSAVLRDLDAARGERAVVARQVTEQEAALRQAAQEVTRLRGDLEAANAQLELAQAAGAESSRLLQRTEALNGELAQRSAQLDQLRVWLGERDSELEQLRLVARDRDEELRRVASLLAEREAALLGAQSVHQGLELRVAQGEQECAALRATLCQAQAELAAQVALLAERGASQAHTRRAVDQLQQTFADVERDLQGEASRLQLLEGAVRGLATRATASNGEVASAMAEVSTLRRRIGELDSEATSLTEQIALRDSERQKLVDEIQRLRGAVHAANTHAAVPGGNGKGWSGAPSALPPELQQRLTSLDHRIQELTTQLGDKDAEIILLYAELGERRRRMQELGELLRQLRRDLANLPEEYVASVLDNLARGLTELAR